MIRVIQYEGDSERVHLLRGQAFDSSLSCYWHECRQHRWSIYSSTISEMWLRKSSQQVDLRASVMRETRARVVLHFARISNCILRWSSMARRRLQREAVAQMRGRYHKKYALCRIGADWTSISQNFDDKRLGLGNRKVVLPMFLRRLHVSLRRCARHLHARRDVISELRERNMTWDMTKYAVNVELVKWPFVLTCTR